jgi:hypothetical protein
MTSMKLIVLITFLSLSSSFADDKCHVVINNENNLYEAKFVENPPKFEGKFPLISYKQNCMKSFLNAIEDGELQFNNFLGDGQAKLVMVYDEIDAPLSKRLKRKFLKKLSKLNSKYSINQFEENGLLQVRITQ